MHIPPCNRALFLIDGLAIWHGFPNITDNKSQQWPQICHFEIDTADMCTLEL